MCVMVDKFMNQGKWEAVRSLVKAGMLKKEDAAAFLKITEPELKERLKEAV